MKIIAVISAFLSIVTGAGIYINTNTSSDIRTSENVSVTAVCETEKTAPAVTETKKEIALKDPGYLNKIKRKRFLNEIKIVVNEQTNFDGILPIIEYSKPEGFKINLRLSSLAQIKYLKNLPKIELGLLKMCVQLLSLL